MDYAVLLADDASLRPMDLARALAAARKVPVLDLAGAMRRAWGIVEEKVEKAAADAAVRHLEVGGLRALAVPASLVEELPPAEPMTALELSADTASYRERDQPARSFPWPSLCLLAAAGYTQTTRRHAEPETRPNPAKEMLKTGLSLMTGMPTSLGLGPKPEAKSVEVSDTRFLLDLVLKGPPQRLRIEAERFDFSCLKARKGYGIQANLRVLLEELSRLAPAAALSRGAQVLLGAKPQRDLAYGGPGDLERESRWRLTLASLRPPGHT